MKKFSIRTFGCQMNFHDSEKMAGILSAHGYSPTDNRTEADIIVFNTCSIRQKAEQKFLSELGRLKALKKRRPALKIIVAGCVAQQRREEILKDLGHVDLVIGPQNISQIGRLLERTERLAAIEDNPALANEELPTLRTEQGRAWVSIMYGCNNFCTYCIVPYTRGREVSRPSESIIKEIEELVRQGFKEVTLLGQNVNSYRSDCDFPGLLRKLNTINGLLRIRFVTSHPRDFSDSLIEAMAELDKVCEHIHLPLQSGSTRVLSLMNRGYSYDEYRQKVDKLRKKIPSIAITTDIIAGFPGETDKDHEATINALKEIEYDGIFAFKYSPRPGTKAAEMKAQVDDAVKTERLTEILKIQDEITYRKNKNLEGMVFEVLVEGKSETNDGQLTGRTRTNKIVNWPDDGSPAGTMAFIEIIAGKKHSLEGRSVKK